MKEKESYTLAVFVVVWRKRTNGQTGEKRINVIPP
jgi:hypothetical protein